MNRALGHFCAHIDLSRWREALHNSRPTLNRAHPRHESGRYCNTFYARHSVDYVDGGRGGGMWDD